jgi:chromosomal replication initiator protein
MDDNLSPIKQIIKEEIGDESSYRTWIEPLNFKDFSNDTLVLSVPNKFFGEWINDHYKTTIQSCASKFLRTKELQLHIVVDTSINRPYEDAEKKQKSKTDLRKSLTSPLFNPSYTFDTFVVGDSNQFAQAASLAVASAPGQTYNPLFIYGGVGLGKTHLLNAIGNYALESGYVSSPRNISFISGEVFTNEVINAIRYDRMEEFRKKFRNVDILMIDDIQFIAGKERTQAEFFHTFNALYIAKKQIVVTSDKFPKDIKNLEERLRSRFEWGLIADIQPPDIETKVAILKKKSERENIHLPDEVAMFLAAKASSNIRILEGMLTRLGAFASFTGKPITIPLTKEILKGILKDTDKPVMIEDIQKVVCEHFGIRVPDIKSKRRSKSLVLPRQIAMYLSRNICKVSLADIGEKFGGKDHSTVIHAIKKIEKQMEKDPKLLQTIEEVKLKIYS